MNSIDVNEVCEEEKESVFLLQQLYFLGQLSGLKTLNTLLGYHGITSNKWYKMRKQLSLDVLRKMMNSYLEEQLLNKLVAIHKKSDSMWSRYRVTVIIDDSVFRMWLEKHEEFQDFYYWTYSGQYDKVVKGFSPNVLGLHINGVFYPLYIDFIRKSDKSRRKKSALRLLNKWAQFSVKMKQRGLVLKELYASFDNGFHDKLIIEKCEQYGLNLICVPTRTNNITVNGQTLQIQKYIKTMFIYKEKIYYKKHGKGEDIEPFTLRTRAYYPALKKEVVVLFFRLKGSSKVSVVYTTNIHIKAKTMRGHWFTRTQIEQFFRLLKHTFEISQSTVDNFINFQKRLFLNILTATMTLGFVQFIRKKIKRYIPQIQKCGIQRIGIIFRRFLKEIPFLKQIINDPFCMNEILKT